MSNYILQGTSLKDIQHFETVNEIIDIHHEVFNPYRLLILYGLYQKQLLSFPQLKELTKIKSDGNLSSHLRALENQKLIQYHQAFSGRRKLTFYDLTNDGKKLFEQVIAGLEKFLAGIEK